MTRKQKRILLRIIASALLLIVAIITDKLKLHETLSAAFYLASFITIGYDVIIKAVLGLRHRRLLDENFLMAVASIGAVVLSEFAESVAVMLFYQIGEFFQSYAVGKSRKSIAELMDIRPDIARVIRNGEECIVSPQDVMVGEVITVLGGEKIALDGVVTEGKSYVDTSALTGESAPRDISIESRVLAGFINMGGAVKVEVTKPFSESSVSKITQLIENAAVNKTKSEKFITKFARWYTPAVIVGALLLAIIPQFFGGDLLMWIKRALIFLVISCPCALVISVPLTFFGGIGAASKRGVLIKGTGFMETLSECDTFVFDKTGTLTKGSFAVSHIKSEKLSDEVLLAVCAAAESYSNHPIAKSIVSAAKENYKKFLVSDVKELTGYGIFAKVENREVFVGNTKLMNRIGIFCEEDDSLAVHIAISGEYAGTVFLADEIKEETSEAVERLYQLGIKETYMLTGDRQEIAEKTANTAGIKNVCASLLPEEKVSALEKIKKEGRKIAYVGDGINDAPVIALADVGIAMGALGSDAAVEAADIVLMDDNPLKLGEALKVSRRTRSIATQNIVFALFVKALFLILGALGIAGMFGAVVADVGVAIIAILNAMRALK